MMKARVQGVNSAGAGDTGKSIMSKERSKAQATPESAKSLMKAATKAAATAKYEPPKSPLEDIAKVLEKKA